MMWSAVFGRLQPSWVIRLVERLAGLTIPSSILQPPADRLSGAIAFSARRSCSVIVFFRTIVVFVLLARGGLRVVQGPGAQQASSQCRALRICFFFN